MNLEEYSKFIEEHGYYEEKEAVRVVRKILDYHINYNYTEYDSYELYPRFIFSGDREKIEMDLLIILRHPKKRYERKIGVEFKETDMRKVLSQAITRRKYVDYMYVATKNVFLTYKEILIMCFFGLGWIIWEEGFAKMIFPARYTTTDYIFEDIINSILRMKLEEKKEEIKEEIDKIVKLDEFIKEE